MGSFQVRTLSLLLGETRFPGTQVASIRGRGQDVALSVRDLSGTSWRSEEQQIGPRWGFSKGKILRKTSSTPFD